MTGIARDLHYAWRRLRATPIFTGFAVVTLALGIGVTTGIYSAVRAVLSPPSGLAEIDRLVTVTRMAFGSGPMTSFSWPELRDLLDQQTVFDRVAAWAFFRQAYSANGRSGIGFGECVSADYFQTLGVKPRLGRLLQPSDDRPDAPLVAVISDAVWRRLFDSSPDVVGRLVKMNGATFEVVGVAAPDFRGLFNGGMVPTAMWVPMAATRLLPNAGLGFTFDPASRDRRWIRLTARLAPDRTVDDARTEISAISARLNAAYLAPRSGSAERRPDWVARPVTDVPKLLNAEFFIGPLATALMVAVGLVFLIACTNVANLGLARGSTRHHESGVRIALGASRWRLFRESLAEGVLLSIIGGAVALGLAQAVIRVLQSELVVENSLSIQLQPTLDLSVAGAALAATLLALVVAGVGPAIRASRADVRTVLVTDSPGTSPVRWRARRYLIALQVSASVLLVAIAALCIGQVRQQGSVDTGIEFSRLALIEVDFAQQRYDESRVRSIVTEVLRQLSLRPDVEAAAASSGLPVGIDTPHASVTGPGGTAYAELMAATPDIHRGLGVRIERGRALGAGDGDSSQRVVVLSSHTARTLFGAEDPLGRTVRFQRNRWAGEADWPFEELTVIGVAADTDALMIGRRSHGTVYVPWAQRPEGKLVFSARATGDPAVVLTAMRDILSTISPDVPPTQALTGATLLAQDVLFFQVVAGLASLLGGVGLVVALAGLYGILSFVIASRTREIGLRIALGATTAAIRRQVLREGLSPVLLGLVIGLGLGALARMGVRPMFRVLLPALDVTMLLLVPALFIAAGIVAIYLPARRASRVDPNVALRSL